MKFILFLEEKIFFVLFQISFIFFVTLLLILMGNKFCLVFFIGTFLIIYTLSSLGIEFYYKNKEYEKIINLVDGLEEKYLIAEVLSKPKSIENRAYYYALTGACLAMNNKIGTLEKEQEDFQEYVEGFAHDIKTPIASLSLFFDNQNNLELKEELQVIENKVEQMLFYARSGSPEKDYFIKEISLDNLLHPVIVSYKNYLLKNKVKVFTHDLDFIVFTDLKWLHFIISQIIQNSIKYFDKEDKIIEISAQEKRNSIILFIRDNGCGINMSDLYRVFEKGFTGTNRNKENSTGMGLYLSKKLCDRLGLSLTIESKEQEFTLLKIGFPKSNLHKMN